MCVNGVPWLRHIDYMLDGSRTAGVAALTFRTAESCPRSLVYWPWVGTVSDVCTMAVSPLFFYGDSARAQHFEKGILCSVLLHCIFLYPALRNVWVSPLHSRPRLPARRFLYGCLEEHQTAWRPAPPPCHPTLIH